MYAETPGGGHGRREWEIECGCIEEAVEKFGKLGAPEMQIEGAALGTLIARIVEAGILVVYLLKFDTKIVDRLRNETVNNAVGTAGAIV